MKKVYHNKAYQEKTEALLTKLKPILLKKNKRNLLQKFLDIINKNDYNFKYHTNEKADPDKIPNPTRIAMHNFRFFEPNELPKELKANEVSEAFNEKLIAATIERI